MKYSRMYLQLKLYLLVGEYSNLKMKGKLFDCCVITAYSKVIHKRCEKEGPRIVRAVMTQNFLWPPQNSFLSQPHYKSFPCSSSHIVTKAQSSLYVIRIKWSINNTKTQLLYITKICPVSYWNMSL
jgi:hypothetical protein